MIGQDDIIDFDTIDQAKQYVKEITSEYSYERELDWKTFDRYQRIVKQKHDLYWSDETEVQLYVSVYEFAEGAGVSSRTQYTSMLVIYAERNDLKSFAELYRKTSNLDTKALAFNHAVRYGSLDIIDYYYNENLLDDLTIYGGEIHRAVLWDNLAALKRIMHHNNYSIEKLTLGLLFHENAVRIFKYVLEQRGAEMVYNLSFVDARASYILSEGADRENETIRLWRKGFWKRFGY
jgi:hypothetical protein